MGTRFRGYVWLFVTILLFSTYEVVALRYTSGIHPLLVNGIRFTLGGIVLLPFAVVQLRREAIRIDTWALASLWGLGLLNAGLCLGLLQYSLKYTQASVAAVLFSTNPLFVAMIAAVVFKERITARRLAGIGIGIVGTMLIMGGLSVDSALGPALALGAAAVWGVYTVLGKAYTARYGSVVVNALSFVLGGITIIAALPLLGIRVSQIATENWLALAYLSILVTGFAYYAFFQGLSYLEASAGASVFFAKPVFASLLAWAILGEPLTGTKLAGIGLILAAMTLVTGRPKASGSPSRSGASAKPVHTSGASAPG